jgi:hypothetical protein
VRKPVWKGEKGGPVAGGLQKWPDTGEIAEKVAFFGKKL